ncbi:MAG: ribosome-binding factor A [bacterium]
MSRIDQINQLLHSELADLAQQYIQIDGVLITITQVECSPDLKRAKIFVSVLPDKFFGTALKELRKHSKLFIKKLGRLNLRSTPRLEWTIDSREKKAAEIEDILKQI